MQYNLWTLVPLVIAALVTVNLAIKKLVRVARRERAVILTAVDPEKRIQATPSDRH